MRHQDSGIWIGDLDSPADPTAAATPSPCSSCRSEQQPPPRRSNAFRSPMSGSGGSLKPTVQRIGQCDLGPARAKQSSACGPAGADVGGGIDHSTFVLSEASTDELGYLEPGVATAVSPRELAEALDIDVVQLSVTSATLLTSAVGLTKHAQAVPTATNPSPERLRPVLRVPSSGGVGCTPKIGRRQAEAQLAAAGAERGTFLFRQGSSGRTVLTVSDGDIVRARDDLLDLLIGLCGAPMPRPATCQRRATVAPTARGTRLRSCVPPHGQASPHQTQTTLWHGCTCVLHVRGAHCWVHRTFPSPSTILGLVLRSTTSSSTTSRAHRSPCLTSGSGRHSSATTRMIRARSPPRSPGSCSAESSLPQPRHQQSGKANTDPSCRCTIASGTQTRAVHDICAACDAERFVFRFFYKYLLNLPTLLSPAWVYNLK